MNELDRLFAAWLAGPLAEADAGRLRELLGIPDQRRRWRALAEMGAAAAAESERASPNTTQRILIKRAPRRRWRALAMAAGLLLGACRG